ncbi:hypothetical protein V6N13_106223 [Hibiscus sabdariffa]
MTSVCSIRSIILRLHDWDIGEINVLRMGSKLFLLSFEDDELYMMPEDLNWSYLKEIFVDVRPWSESLKRPERATWLEVSGVPVHCWNHTTLKRVGELWGTFEAFGKNIKHCKDCEKVYVLISTSQTKRIEEVIEVEVGKSSSAPEKNVSSEGDRSYSRVEEEALNVMCANKSFNNCQAQGSERIGCQLGESELIGGGFKESPEVLVDNQEKQPGVMENVRGNECDQSVDTNARGLSWAKTDAKGLHKANEIPNQNQTVKDINQVGEREDLLYPRAVENICNMGLKVANPAKDSWAKEIKNKINKGWSPNKEIHDQSTGTHSEEEEDKSFFPELEARKNKWSYGKSWAT